MSISGTLSRLEFVVLDSTADDIEPMHIIYRGVKREHKKTPLRQLIRALIRLVSLGYLEAHYLHFEGDRYERLSFIEDKMLMTHCAGRRGTKLEQYPFDSQQGEYFFKMTDAGRKEQEKDIYKKYYR